MKKFIITNGDNQKVEVDLVRYFKFKNDVFLIYTMNEIDEKNYVKLYLVRIMEELGFPVVQTIGNDADWSSMQGIVKKVLKEIKSGKRKMLEDLDYRDVLGIKIVNPRYFKIEQKLVDVLSSNYFDNNEEMTPVEENKQIDNSEMIPLESIDTTIEKEGKFDPEKNETISSNQSSALNIENNSNITDEPVNNMEMINELNSNDNNEKEEISMQPIIESVDYNSMVNVGNIVEESEENKDNINNHQIVNVDGNINELKPIPDSVQTEVNNKVLPSESENVLDKEGLNTNDKKRDIDYESLYISVKKENETSAALIDSLMTQLLKYKEKYGELEDEQLKN